jgi:hypothetical protein
MDYELAKQLKDRGFPTKCQSLQTVFTDKDDFTLFDAPTLEDLIESCPTNIGKATFVLGSADQGKEWVACYFDFVTNRGSEFNESGSTPAEAVAKLWLALHAPGARA